MTTILALRRAWVRVLSRFSRRLNRMSSSIATATLFVVTIQYLDRNITQYGPESSIRKTDLFHIAYYPQVYNWMVCGPQRYYANLYE